MRRKILVVVGFALVGVVLFTGCSQDTPGPQSTSAPSPSASPPATRQSHDEALYVYGNYVSKAYNLRSTVASGRSSALGAWATGEALDNAVKAAAVMDEHDIRNLGFIGVRPQLVAWSPKAVSIFDCQDLSQSSTQQGEYGRAIGKVSNRFSEATLIRDPDGKWKVSKASQSPLNCKPHTDPYYWLGAQSHPSNADEEAAFAAYKRYWDLMYSLSNYPRDQWKLLIGKVAAKKPSEVALGVANDITKNDYKMSGQWRSNPIVIGTARDKIEVYDCRDDSKVNYVDRNGVVKGEFDKDTPFRALVEKDKTGTWLVVDLARVGNEVTCR